MLPGRATGLPKDSVATVSLIVALDRAVLSDRVGRISGKRMESVLSGIDIVLGR